MKPLNPETYWTPEQMRSFWACMELPRPRRIIESTPMEGTTFFDAVYVDNRLPPNTAVLQNPTDEVRLLNVGDSDEE